MDFRALLEALATFILSPIALIVLAIIAFGVIALLIRSAYRRR
jgi:hypothetical protein